MVEVAQDIEQVESWDPGSAGKVPVGIYEAQVEAVEVKTSTTGYPKLGMKMRVVSGEFTGGILFGDRSLHPNALPYFRGLLDVLNLYATGKNVDEQKLVGRFLKVQAVEYDKSDGSKGVSVEKFFKSDINAGKNDEMDISAHSNGGTVAGEKATPRPGNGAAKAGQKSSGATPAAGGKKVPDDDLPF